MLFSPELRARLKLTQDALRRLPLRVAPANEQVRIVAKIEELFSELDKGVESLKTVRRHLDVYRQSVLKHAFEGKLTTQWREENEDKVETPDQLLTRVKQARQNRYEGQLKEWSHKRKDTQKSRKPKIDFRSSRPTGSSETARRLGSLPNGWQWINVQAILAEPPANGHSVTSGDQGFPVLRLTAIKENKLDLAEVKYGNWAREDALPYLVREGDFLLARGNGSRHLVGRGGPVPALEREVAYPDTMIRLRLEPAVIHPTFFSYVWNSYLLRRQIEASARTTAGIYKINQRDILDFVVPLCSLAEQAKVVEYLSTAMSRNSEVGARIDNQLDLTRALRQSILKKAFSGDLVLQDPTDEPASVLLDRIKAEREQASRGTGAKGRRRTEREVP